jgi:hypothetical protein
MFPSICRNRLAGQRTGVLLGSARSGPTARYCALKRKHPLDQRTLENVERIAEIGRVKILRIFGAPPKIRRFLSIRRAAADVALFVTSLIYWTFPAEHAAVSRLARFLRGEFKEEPVHRIVVSG